MSLWTAILDWSCIKSFSLYRSMGNLTFREYKRKLVKQLCVEVAVMEVAMAVAVADVTMAVAEVGRIEMTTAMAAAAVSHHLRIPSTCHSSVTT